MSEIVSAIEHEANVSSKPLDWTIQSRERHGQLWKVFVEPGERGPQLDESLEGAAAWWRGPPTGSADVLSVVPDDFQINLRYATSDVPQRGRIRIYPIRFLDKLAEAWSNPGRGALFCRAYEKLEANSADRVFENPNPKWCSELRPAQRDAFKLLSHGLSFLWGPPGTGKTHTVGAMLASFLVENRTARVLLLSTTNTAVDLALVAVDKALDRLSKIEPRAAIAGRCCKRIGAHFGARHYKDRQHLIPRTSEAIIRRLAELESTPPDAVDIAAYEKWKITVEELRAQMQTQAKEVLLSSRLVALTCTRGIFSCSELEEAAPFDLVVFDEASQVGLSHALPFIPLAGRVLFAGDTQQLEPIVVAEDERVRTWLGHSPFKFANKKKENTVFLTEQSRMCADICRVVSQTFYDGDLQVCSKSGCGY